MEFLRPPDSRFANLPGYAFSPQYLMVDDGEGGQWRMHYLDEGPASADPLLMQKQIPGTRGQAHTTIIDAGHFLQEDQGERLAEVVVEFIAATPL